jgi:hypothetical protein
VGTQNTFVFTILKPSGVELRHVGQVMQKINTVYPATNFVAFNFAFSAKTLGTKMPPSIQRIRSDTHEKRNSFSFLLQNVDLLTFYYM